MTVLIDTNIILDFFQKRDKYDSAEIIIKLCADKKITGYMAAHSVPDIYYITRKYFSDAERRNMLVNLLSIIPVATLNHEEIISALNNERFSDFEDCLQSECAAAVHADFIITRNTKDFSESNVPSLTPDAFIKLI